MEVTFKGKKIDIEVKKVSIVGSFIGLMLKSSNTANLLFEFNKIGTQTIHSLFVFFPFLAIWLDENNKVLNYKIVKPFTFRVESSKFTKKLIEIPFTYNNKKILNFFVGKGKI